MNQRPKPSAVQFTLASPRTKDSTRNSTRSMPSGNRARRISRASNTKAGNACWSRMTRGGFTGGDMERPALRRLLKGIEGGKVDCVVVYKVDRLNRLLLNFAKIMQIFEEQNASSCSVTQHRRT